MNFKFDEFFFSFLRKKNWKISFQQRKMLMAFCVFLCIIAALSYALIIFSAHQTFKMLASTPLSDQTRKLQREMTIGMILQVNDFLLTPLQVKSYL